MGFSINLNKTERELASAYAKMHSISLGYKPKRASFEKKSNEYDTKVADKAYEEYIKDGKNSRPIEELWK